MQKKDFWLNDRTKRAKRAQLKRAKERVMNHTAQICLSSLLAMSLLVGTSAASAAADNSDTQGAPELNGPHVLTEKKVRLSGDGNNVVRSGPGDSFAIVGIYKKGLEFVVIAKRDEWYNIRLSDTNTGWIHSSLCEEFDDMSDLEFRPNPRC